MSVAAKHPGKAHSVRKQNPSLQQRQKTVLLIFGIAVIVLIGGMLFLSGGKSRGVPDFTASTISGEMVHLSDFRGQVVMLNFWATWCPPCRAEMPTIQAAYTRYHEHGFTVLAINNSEPADQIQPFALELSLQFPVVMDTEAALQRTFAITGYPTSLFIAPDGSQYAQHSGMLTADQLNEYIRTGLARIQTPPKI